MSKNYRFVSWNVNGLRAVLGKGFMDFFNEAGADIFCIQETKMQEGQAELLTPGYHQYFNYADKKGYSGTAVFTKEEPINVIYGMGIDEHDHEGRLITLEFDNYYFICGYVPNSQNELKRLDYRMKWEDDFRNYASELAKKKTVVFCGDLNVAHEEIDLKNPKTNHMSAGFSDEERGKFSELLAAGFVDSFRYLNPDLAGAYTWWSYRMNARAKDVGWRIDYFVVSEAAKENIRNFTIHKDVFGSDHCPVELEMTL